MDRSVEVFEKANELIVDDQTNSKSDSKMKLWWAIFRNKFSWLLTGKTPWLIRIVRNRRTSNLSHQLPLCREMNRKVRIKSMFVTDHFYRLPSPPTHSTLIPFWGGLQPIRLNIMFLSIAVVVYIRAMTFMVPHNSNPCCCTESQHMLVGGCPVMWALLSSDLQK